MIEMYSHLMSRNIVTNGEYTTIMMMMMMMIIIIIIIMF